MRFATLVVEQLDRAATELAVAHPLNARIALILVDNAAELIIHRRCESLIRHGRKQGTPKIDAAKRRSVLGHYFGEKIKFLEAVEAISALERHFIAELHAQRNVLYHVGLTDDDIIRPLANAYFRLTCVLLARLDNKSLGWPRDLVIGDALHAYFPDAAKGSRFPGCDSGRISKQLLHRTPADMPALAEALATHSEAVVARTEQQFDSIKHGLDKRSAASETFRRLQRTADFQKKIAKDRMRKKGMDDVFVPFGHPFMDKIATRLMPGWKPRYASPPFAKWRTRAKRIGKEKDPLLSVRKFTELRGEMEYLVEAVGEAHEEFWGWVQQQEDAMQDAR